MKFIDVYFSPKQISNPETFSPSPRKPALVVANWIETSLPIRIIDPVPVTRKQIAHAHDRSYVHGVLDCDLRNGFCGRQRDVAESLPWTSGSILSAARCALDNGLVACSPTSGFHHASYKSGFGYCTFNGLMVTALVLKAEKKSGELAFWTATSTTVMELQKSLHDLLLTGFVMSQRNTALHPIPRDLSIS
ncbi:hypothetical protein [Candidatus Nitrotoga sp. AM1P]|uniref:hypothetical protein n=1 Tax=Candidatus Nitrotoga sp. AM1P TaxID=2559597 RepID=UPI0015639E4A|nr:hypothetical protein [Candidatus Nitrotoga sp. AM1P]